MVLTILLAISLSLDALGIGGTYGLRKITIPPLTKLILAIETAFLLSIFLYFGKQLTYFFPASLANGIGVAVLFFMGIWLFSQGFRKKEGSPSLLLHPTACDKDNSSVLEPKEAIALGLVLSLDAMGTGVGAGASGINLPLLPLFAALLQTLFLSIGCYFGQKFSDLVQEDGRLTSLSGGILVVIACVRAFF